ncbi:hypothetical protein GDO81_024456 [Engystomops pustulosus]|uniref:Uncharacterized protein n=1 Tax=Engystomops pustulosus TaxID=76066 RepID=A0AAV6YR82_ENGPU|nr:hypothetical protein GDO81_024456 [Engystomops pustulosus]
MIGGSVKIREVSEESIMIPPAPGFTGSFKQTVIRIVHLLFPYQQSLTFKACNVVGLPWSMGDDLRIDGDAHCCMDYCLIVLLLNVKYLVLYWSSWYLTTDTLTRLALKIRMNSDWILLGFFWSYLLVFVAKSHLDIVQGCYGSIHICMFQGKNKSPCVTPCLH